MRQRHRPRPRQTAAPAHERGRRHRVVRGDERWRGGQGLLRVERPGQRAHRGYLERGVGVEVGQQPGHPARQHRLARPGRTDHQQVMAPGRRDLHRPAGRELPDDVREVVRRGAAAGARPRPDDAQRPRLAAQPGEHVGQVLGAEYLQALHQARLDRGGRRHHHALHPETTCGQQRRQDPAHAADPSVERELAEQHHPAQPRHRHRARRREHGAGQREVVPAALLRQRRRGQRQRDAARRPGLPGVDDRRPHPVARLGQGRVRQTHQGDPGQTLADVGLDLDDLAVDPAQPDRPRARERHVRTPPRSARSAAPRRAPAVRRPRRSAPRRTRTRRPRAAARASAARGAGCGRPWPA